MTVKLVFSISGFKYVISEAVLSYAQFLTPSHISCYNHVNLTLCPRMMRGVLVFQETSLLIGTILVVLLPHPEFFLNFF